MSSLGAFSTVKNELTAKKTVINKGFDFCCECWFLLLLLSSLSQMKEIHFTQTMIIALPGSLFPEGKVCDEALSHFSPTL